MVWGTGKTVQWVKEFYVDSKPDNLNSIAGIYTLKEERTGFPQAVL